MKTSQHVIKEIVERDRRQMYAILHSMKTIGKALDERYDEMQNLTVLFAKLEVPDVFRTLSSGMTALEVKYYLGVLVLQKFVPIHARLV